MQYVDIILLFVSKDSTFDSLNSQCLEIFGFIKIDFMCFSNLVFLKIYSVFPQKKCVFFLRIIHKEKLLRQRPWYITNEKLPLISWSVYSEFWPDWPLWRHANECVCVCVCVCHRRGAQIFIHCILAEIYRHKRGHHISQTNTP